LSIETDALRLPDSNSGTEVPKDDPFAQYRLGASDSTLQVTENKPYPTLESTPLQDGGAKPFSSDNTAAITDPTLDQMRDLLNTDLPFAQYHANSEDINSLTPEDLKNVGDLTRAMQALDFKKFDTILSKYSCSQDRIRAIIMGTNLWLGHVGLREKYYLARGSSNYDPDHIKTWINPDTGNELWIKGGGPIVPVDIWPWSGGTATPIHHFEADEPCG
jgi:hypothetical protein